MRSEHDDVYSLLPWYLNGSLHERDTNRVNAHLKDCETCTQALQEEIKIAQQLQAEPIELQQLLARKSQNYEQLKTRLQQAKNTRAWRINIPQIAALVLFASFLGFFGARMADEGEYVTLTHSVANEVAVLQVMFESHTTERELRRLLLDADARLLGGPSEKGVYRLQVPEGDDASRYAKRLREHPATRYVEVEQR